MAIRSGTDGEDSRAAGGGAAVGFAAKALEEKAPVELRSDFSRLVDLEAALGFRFEARCFAIAVGCGGYERERERELGGGLSVWCLVGEGEFPDGAFFLFGVPLYRLTASSADRRRRNNPAKHETEKPEGRLNL